MKKFFAFLILVFGIATIFSTPTLAAESTSNVVETNLFGNVEDDGSGCGVFMILNLVLNILSGGVGVAGLIGISIVGIRYLTSAGNEEQARTSRHRMFQVVIGLAVFAVMYAITSFLLPGGTLNTSSTCKTISTAELNKRRAAELKAKQEEQKKSASSNKNSSKKSTSSTTNTGIDSNGTTALGRKFLKEVEKTVNEFVKMGVYYHVESSSSWSELKRTKRADCTSAADLTMQRMKLIPVNSYIYFDDYGKTLKMRRGADKGIKKHFKIIKGNNTIANLIKKKKLAPGDVCGDANYKHHTIIYLGKKGGSHRIHSFGGGNGVKFSKKNDHNVKVSGSYKIGTCLHPNK